MKDPYSVLGISPTATDEEIKKTYRELARKYHPDSYQGSPLADLASEKMKEINEAYDTIQKQRAAGNSGSYQNGSSYDGGSYSSSNGRQSSFAEVRRMINGGQYTAAENILDSTPSAGRDAEWNFLKGCICLQRGWYADAQRYIETACYMDPNNMEYRIARERISGSAAGFGRAYRTSTSNGGCSTCDICSGLMCADCLCECCGGDCISCC
ncbi:MAG: J domain-containing protein [Clostridia bacterium]|nr:J domain-containing protein [Clostridia bacterium]